MTKFTDKERELMNKSNSAKQPQLNKTIQRPQEPNQQAPEGYQPVDVNARIAEMEQAANQGVQGLNAAGYTNIQHSIGRHQQVFTSDVNAIKDSLKFYLSPDAKMAVATIQAVQEISREGGMGVEITVGKFLPDLPEVPQLPDFSRFYQSSAYQAGQQVLTSGSSEENPPQTSL